MRHQHRKPSRDEAEKPFWISFSDMMTALMVLFLVVMTVTLLAVTHTVSETERVKAARDAAISALMARVRLAVEDYPGITVRGTTIDFGDQARFDTDSALLTPGQARHLRAFVPHILAIARDPLGRQWLKRVVVEGYADQRGTYLHNLDLSMKRSERVLFALLEEPEPGEKPLSLEDRLLVEQLFLVGGASFTSLKDTLEESRRIEMKLEFLDTGEAGAETRPVELARSASGTERRP
ncbi:MAG TPA: flagellar motor protein MotB [Deltaproteobacteria bacterium]|nr:flagellar motor protein MotB [Deltaproteobacteria bacterium]HQI80718.1 flagellar motor protein MotB [Deltaproteobacteria bacterium]